jgi:hypothetical protein
VTITNGYLTTAEARNYAGLSDLADTELLDDVVTAVSRAIDNACQRTFYQDVAQARTFATDYGTKLVLGAFNDLVSVTTLKFDEDGDSVFEKTIAAANFGLLPPDGGGSPRRARTRSSSCTTQRSSPCPAAPLAAAAPTSRRSPAPGAGPPCRRRSSRRAVCRSPES